MAQQKWTWLVSMRTWVQFLAWMSGLRTWHCHSCGTGLIPALEFLNDMGVAKKNFFLRVPVVAQWKWIWLAHKAAGLIPGLAQWVKDSASLLLWCRQTATAPIQPLAWELPHAVGVALKSKNKNKNLAQVPLCSIFLKEISLNSLGIFNPTNWKRAV